MSAIPSTATSLEILGPHSAGDEAVLTPEALAFVAELVRAFAPRIEALLAARRERQARFDAGERPDFLPETAAVRADGWTVAPLPHDLQDRRVEITGPVDRKMIINALNSGARVFMADFEDSTTPTWDNVVQGQINLRDAVAGTIRHAAPDTAKVYEVGPDPAVLMVRPRGLHLPEEHLRLNGQPVPGCLVDFGLYFFHNVRALLAKGTGPYFYLPKLQSHREARLWNDVFLRAQEALGLPRGTIKATVLIETLPAAFEMDEILFELREHSAGLNCGRWDYIFSFIKTLRRDPTRVLPDRSQLTMDKGFLSAYVQLLIRTCHRRNAHAMGGMAAYIPVKSDAEANATALAKVRADKLREVHNGHDGTWVAHPGLVPLAREVFDQHMPGPNQIHRKREDVKITRDDLLAVPEGTRTEAGLRHGLRVGLQYLESWLRGTGCVPIYNLMEDAATAEICRTQVWQWIHHRAALDDGSPVTVERFRKLAAEELAGLRDELGAERFEHGRFDEAARLFDRLSTSDEFTEFLTLPAYEAVVTLVARQGA
jgi:malate synthase